MINAQFSFADHNKLNLFVPDDVQILHMCDEGTKMNLLEMFQIHNPLTDLKVTCLNEQLQPRTNYIFLKRLFQHYS